MKARIIDICYPCYFPGTSNDYIQVLVDAETTYGSLKDAILQENEEGWRGNAPDPLTDKYIAECTKAIHSMFGSGGLAVLVDTALVDVEEQLEYDDEESMWCYVEFVL